MNIRESTQSFRKVEQAPTQKGGFLQPQWRTNPRTHEHRSQVLIDYCKGKKCLDVGCASGIQGKGWMHGRLAESIEKISGIDIDVEGIALAKERGYNVQLADAEQFDLGEKFDVITAGELIEHLANPGSFLEQVKKHLNPDGVLVITTPNAFAASNFVYRLKGEARVNRDHMAWYCPVTLRQLFKRHGLETVEIKYVEHFTPGAVRRSLAKMVRAITPAQMKWGTLLAVAKLPASAAN